MEIDLKYKIPLVGEYNRRVYTCPECDANLLDDKHGGMYGYIIGFADTNMGTVSIIECPECFTKWYCHAGGYIAYELFLDVIKAGKHKHFK